MCENELNVISNVTTITSSYLNFANTFIVIATLLVAAITIILMIYHNRDKQKVIKEVTDKFLETLSSDNDLRNIFIQKILSNKDFQQQFEAMIDIHIQDKMDDIAEKANKEEEKNEVGELKWNLNT